MSEEKIKAENLHGFDLKEREIIFQSLLPEEKFVDRRIGAIEQVAPESESEEEPGEFEALRSQGNACNTSSSLASTKMNEKLARQYVGELIQRNELGGSGENSSPRFKGEDQSSKYES